MEMEGHERGRDISHEDEDDKQRNGTLWTATAHCITAVIGSGILALPWSVAQLGWIMGPIVLVAFACISHYTSTLLADCYRSPDPIYGTRNPTYMAVVKSYLGPKNILLCFISQYTSLWGGLLSYTISSATIMSEILRLSCIHSPNTTLCTTSTNLFMIIFGGISILLSMFPNLDKVAWLSVVATVMSSSYSLISLCLSVAQWISHGDTRGSVLGVMSVEDTSLTSASKAWKTLQALGNIAFAYSYAGVLIEIQDTLKSPPSENVTMKRAGLQGISLITIFYTAIGCVGYAAFGNNTPGIILTGFSKPIWLVNVTCIFIIIHLLGAYQVYGQPIFDLTEKKMASNWPEKKFFQPICSVRVPFKKATAIPLVPARIIIRSSIIIFSTLVSMLFPFFNAIMGLLGAVAFWTLTVYFPVSMHLSQRKIGREATKWWLLQGLCLLCLMVCVAAMIGSTAEIIKGLRHVKLFHM